jgi:hypothetical protein
LLQPRSTAVYDLRTARRAGFIKAAFGAGNFIVSPDGTLVAGVETADSSGNAMFATDGTAGAIEIWSVSDGKLVGRVTGGQPVANAPPVVVPVPLAFAAGKLIASGTSHGATGLQEWDPATGGLVHQWNGLGNMPGNMPPVTRTSVAVSNAGSAVAVAAGSVIKVFNTQGGDDIGELSSPIALMEVRGMAFSPDGATMAAVVGPGGTVGSATLLEWDINNGGKLTRQVPIDLSATVPAVDPNASGMGAADWGDVSYLQWKPDGRLVRVGDGLFDVVSGRAIYTLPSRVSGNLSGRLVGLANRRSTYEFLPVGVGDHVVLKTFDLPKAAIDTALASGGSVNVSPAVSVVAAPAVPTASGVNLDLAPGGRNIAMPIAPPPASAAPVATADIAAQGQWNVTVKSITVIDPAGIQKKMDAANQNVTQIQSKLQDAIANLAQASKISDLQDQLLDAKANVITLQRQAQAAPTSRTVAAVLDSGVVVKITTDSDVTAAFADAMHPGERMHVSGTGQVNSGVLGVKLRLAVPSK